MAIRDLGDLQDTVRGIGATPRERVKNLYTIFSDPGEFPRTTVGLAATVSLVGIICLWRRRRPLSVFATTAAAVFVAGSLGLYPVGQRFLLFLFPIVVICLAEGITRIGGIRPPVLAIGLLVGAAALIVGPVVGTVRNGSSFPRKESTSNLLREVETNWQPGDVLYLYPDSQYAFRYYAECDDCGAVTSRARELWPSHPTAGGQPQTTPRSCPTLRA